MVCALRKCAANAKISLNRHKNKKMGLLVQDYCSQIEFSLISLTCSRSELSGVYAFALLKGDNQCAVFLPWSLLSLFWEPAAGRAPFHLYPPWITLVLWQQGNDVVARAFVSLRFLWELSHTHSLHFCMRTDWWCYRSAEWLCGDGAAEHKLIRPPCSCVRR